MKTYKVIRGYFDDNVPDEVLVRGLTLEQARAHCKDPETSSRTATSETAVARTQQFGPWFDRYEEE